MFVANAKEEKLPTFFLKKEKKMIHPPPFTISGTLRQSDV